MKRFLCLFLIVVILLPCTAYADKGITPTASPKPTKFDYTNLEKLSGYKYEKMSKAWRYEAKYEVKYSNGFFQWGLVAEGEKNDQLSAWMYICFYRSDYKEYNKVYEMNILVDDSIYTFANCILSDSETYSTVLFGNIGIDMVKALSTSKDIAFRVHYSDYYYDFEPDIKDLKELTTWAKNVVKKGFIDALDDSYFEYYDLLFKASKEE